jgi:hypothetical protein
MVRILIALMRWLRSLLRKRVKLAGVSRQGTCIKLPGQSPVRDESFSIGTDQNIGRFQIPVNDATAMNIPDSVRDIDKSTDQFSKLLRVTIDREAILRR